MRIWPAIDLRDGRVVQLRGGDPDHVLAEGDDPIAQAEAFVDAGADGLHVVDLDRALGDGDNRTTVRALLDRLDVDVQVAGGLRTAEDVDAMLDAGAVRAVVGTRAIDDPAWLARLAGDRPGRIVVAVDVRDGEVVAEGWTEGTGLDLDAAVDRLATPGLAAWLCTVVDREGRKRGVDPGPYRRLARLVDEPVVAAGGVASRDDLVRLADAGVDEAVVGTALYDGTIDLGEVLADA